jgi:hypothetical protein
MESLKTSPAALAVASYSYSLTNTSAVSDEEAAHACGLERSTTFRAVADLRRIGAINTTKCPLRADGPWPREVRINLAPWVFVAIDQTGASL